ncbi:cupin domain-containing protein [Evansella sp. LMS18]|jgi:mannose-6-phosphate isomerase-like protein (cupin superfamily)|uniref:cupin domain-containing protein n=1 Tax=Evansella sp. LMS18 TaxID=2924033 RepID=UPI0020D13028|nr:cupin domain-containing protein [Evansella sp. LMS18]UTR12682.1 cupin domain-containing protein [Evansella sp. LMS18]
MYYNPNPYQYPYFSNMPMNRSGSTESQSQDTYSQVAGAVLDGLKRESASADLYSRLAEAAPDEEQKNEMLQALNHKRANINEFTILYMNLTGQQPVYETHRIAFDSYRDGLQKAQEAGAENYENYRNNAFHTPHPMVQNIFWHASACEQENLARFETMDGNTGGQDYGSRPFVVNIETATKQNNTFRTALWTGEHLQVTLMSIDVGDDIGLEVHPHLDQFLRIEQGKGLVQMGDSRNNLNFRQEASQDFAIMVPAGKWHNLTNTGNVPLKLYSIYAPPQHPFGTVHKTKAEALAAEEHHD